jgi:hypothetical protein
MAYIAGVRPQRKIHTRKYDFSNTQTFGRIYPGSVQQADFFSDAPYAKG